MKIILFIYLISSIFSYVIFPLKKDKIENSSSYNNKQKDFFDSLLNSGLYITLNIGSQKTAIKTFLIQNKVELIIAGKNIINHKYDETESTTYNMTNNNKIEIDVSMYEEGIFSRDNFHILNNNNEINIFYMDFILGTKSSIAYKNIKEAQVGLHLPLPKSHPEYNLIINLKNTNASSSCNWYLNFDNFGKGEGRMIVDAFPHTLNNKKYNEKNYVKTYAIDRNYAVIWGFKFSSIYYGNQNQKLMLSLDLRAHFEFDYGIISAPLQVGEILQQLFFEKYISQNICFKEKIGVYGNYFFYCKKDQKLDLESFDSIYFACKDLEITFELNYKDLFYIDGDYIYFLIEFSKNSIIWKFGEIFLKKYYIVFNQDEKTVGYYLNMEEEKKPKNKGNNFGEKNTQSIYSILIVIAILIFMFVGSIFLVIYFNNKKYRKKKANELDDEYNYEPSIGNNYRDNYGLLNDNNAIN